MKSRRSRVAFARAATVALGIASAIAFAQGAQPTPAERAIEYRQAVFKVVGGNFGPLAQVAQGKLELPAPATRKYAERLASIAEFTRDAFPDISREGKTRAKAEIWNDRAEFDKLLNELNDKSRALAAVTARTDATPEDFKAAVGAVGNVCKSCHEKFREK